MLLKVLQKSKLILIIFRIIYQINNLSLKDVDCSNEEFKKFVIQQVDERLVFHGII